ncbi:MAG TPA: methionyl-tRNA formyltransferase [Candidatus Saccharimonadales bacterium]|nr:methionyl-tRNA formyltransferase [Candidatus Saccharimonadales bacterium]
MVSSPSSNPKISTPLVYFGTDELSPIILSQLIEGSWNIKAVVTKPDAPKGRTLEMSEPAVKQIAKAHNIKVFQPEKLRDIEPELKDLQAPIGVLVAYGKIIPESILNLFPYGIINVHPSLLPKYRGSSPIEQALLHGDSETGVTIIRLIKEMDAGPIYATEKFKLSDEDTQQNVYPRIGKVGGELLIKTLPRILSGELEPSEQDEKSVSLAPLINKQDSHIDWANETADEIARKVRAFNRWPQSRATITLPEDQSLDVVITLAKTHKGTATRNSSPGRVSYSDKRLLIEAKDGFVEILSLKVPGKKEISGQEFAAGYIPKV